MTHVYQMAIRSLAVLRSMTRALSTVMPINLRCSVLNLADSLSILVRVGCKLKTQKEQRAALKLSGTSVQNRKIEVVKAKQRNFSSRASTAGGNIQNKAKGRNKGTRQNNSDI
jgi:hypothetical protein